MHSRHKSFIMQSKFNYAVKTEVSNLTIITFNIFKYDKLLFQTKVTRFKLKLTTRHYEWSLTIVDHKDIIAYFSEVPTTPTSGVKKSRSQGGGLLKMPDP